jgi:hypothetical protein
MNSRTAVKTANAALTKVARQGLSHVDQAVVEAAAMGVWHGEEEPDLEVVFGPHLADAVDLVERLSYYNVVPQERKKKLLKQVRLLRGSSHLVQDSNFETTFRRFLPRLQPLQTRHFSRA